MSENGSIEVEDTLSILRLGEFPLLVDALKAFHILFS